MYDQLTIPLFLILTYFNSFAGFEACVYLLFFYEHVSIYINY